MDKATNEDQQQADALAADFGAWMKAHPATPTNPIQPAVAASEDPLLTAMKEWSASQMPQTGQLSETTPFNTALSHEIADGIQVAAAVALFAAAMCAVLWCAWRVMRGPIAFVRNLNTIVAAAAKKAA